MKKTKTVILGLIASALSLTAANAQGLLGERYVDINGGYERFKFSDFGTSVNFDGWGAGAAVNFPLVPAAQFGVDLEAGADYIRGTESGFTLSTTEVGGLLRAYIPLEQGLKPYAGAGLDYFRAKLSGNGGSESDDTFYIPLEVGLEFASGQFSLTPFFRYAFATDSDWEDYWSIGARAAYWLDLSWGLTASISHTDFDDGLELFGVRVGVVFAY